MKARMSYSGVCWLTHQSVTSHSNQWTSSKRVGRSYPGAWTWPLIPRAEPWSGMRSGHLTGTTCVQAGRMEFSSDPNLSTCWSPPVRPVALPFNLYPSVGLCWLIRYYPAPLTIPTCLFTCPSGLRPPSVSVNQNTAVRLVGERFEVTCMSSSTTHRINLTWVHLTKKVRCRVWCRGHVCQRSPVDLLMFLGCLFYPGLCCWRQARLSEQSPVHQQHTDGLCCQSWRRRNLHL